MYVRIYIYTCTLLSCIVVIHESQVSSPFYTHMYLTCIIVKSHCTRTCTGTYTILYRQCLKLYIMFECETISNQ